MLLAIPLHFPTFELMIKNIVFDLGAVILEISLDAYVHELKRLAPNANFDFDHNKHHFYADYEKGIITEELFFNEMAKALNFEVEINALKQAWSKILLEPYTEAKEFIDSLDPTIRTFILSNTNHTHRLQFDQIFNEHWGHQKFYDQFEKNYYSFDMKLIKPDPRIFTQVIEEQNLNPSETLFIDDNLDNIKSAENVGLKAWHFKGQQDWKSITDKYLNQ
jgi:putative hydrolase of the HAD superfamily